MSQQTQPNFKLQFFVIICYTATVYPNYNIVLTLWPHGLALQVRVKTAISSTSTALRHIAIHYIDAFDLQRWCYEMKTKVTDDRRCCRWVKTRSSAVTDCSLTGAWHGEWQQYLQSQQSLLWYSHSCVLLTTLTSRCHVLPLSSVRAY